MSERVLVENAGGIARNMFNRIDGGNCRNLSMARLLLAAVIRCKQDPADGVAAFLAKRPPSFA